MKGRVAAGRCSGSVEEASNSNDTESACFRSHRHVRILGAVATIPLLGVATDCKSIQAQNDLVVLRANPRRTPEILKGLALKSVRSKIKGPQQLVQGWLVPIMTSPQFIVRNLVGGQCL